MQVNSPDPIAAEAGYEAYERGRTMASCPHPPRSVASQAWLWGFGWARMKAQRWQKESLWA